MRMGITMRMSVTIRITISMNHVKSKMPLPGKRKGRRTLR